MDDAVDRGRELVPPQDDSIIAAAGNSALAAAPGNIP